VAPAFFFTGEILRQPSNPLQVIFLLLPKIGFGVTLAGCTENGGAMEKVLLADFSESRELEVFCPNRKQTAIIHLSFGSVPGARIAGTCPLCGEGHFKMTEEFKNRLAEAQNPLKFVYNPFEALADAFDSLAPMLPKLRIYESGVKQTSQVAAAPPATLP
jgi:hypothetical protein